MVRKDDCLNCDDKVWEVNGEPWYHPATGMRKCATTRGTMATPKTMAVTSTSDAVWLRRANPSLGVAVSDNAIRRAMTTDPVDLPGFPRPEDGDRSTYTAELCCVCEKAAAAYRNWRDQPFCKPCADAAEDAADAVTKTVDQPPAEYGKGRCLEGRWCEDATCVKAGHPGVVPVEYLSARQRKTVGLEPLVIAATEQFIGGDKWDAVTEAPDTTYATLTLNMDNPTDRAFHELSNVIRSKRGDYAADGDEFSNFRDMAAMFGGYPWDAANVLEMCKLSRLKALTANGREPANESVLDSHRDKAAYALLAFAMLLAEGSTWEGTS